MPPLGEACIRKLGSADDVDAPADDASSPARGGGGGGAARSAPLEHRQRVRAKRTVKKIGGREAIERQAAFVLRPMPDADGKVEVKFVDNFALDDEDSEESVLAARISKPLGFGGGGGAAWGGGGGGGVAWADKRSGMGTEDVEEEVKELEYAVGDKVGRARAARGRRSRGGRVLGVVCCVAQSS